MDEFSRLESSVNSVKGMLQQVSKEKMNKDQTTLLEPKFQGCFFSGLCRMDLDEMANHY